VFPLLLEIVELIVDFFLRQSVYNFAQAFSVLVESERQSVSLPVRLGRHRLAYPPVTQLNCNGLPEVFDVDVDLPDSVGGSGSQCDREAWATRLIRTGRVSNVILEQTIMSPVFFAPWAISHGACNSKLALSSNHHALSRSNYHLER